MATANLSALFLRGSSVEKSIEVERTDPSVHSPVNFHCACHVSTTCMGLEMTIKIISFPGSHRSSNNFAGKKLYIKYFLYKDETGIRTKYLAVVMMK